MIYLSVIIPAYNEEENLGATLREISGYIAGKGFDAEVIVVDDGSEDKTFEVARRCSSLFKNFRLLKNETNQGKGYSVKKGIFSANGEYLLFMDADNSTSIRELDNFLPFLESYDAVIGSRRMAGAHIEKRQPLTRMILGKIYILLSGIITGLRISDFNCGFKAYRKEAAMVVFGKQVLKGWAFDTELIFLLKKFGMKVKEVPVHWAHKDTSKTRLLMDGIRSFAGLLQIKANDVKGIYD